MALYTPKAYIKLLLLFAFFACLGLSLTSAVADDEPISIAADEMMSTEKSNSVTFKGDVDAKQAGLRIRSDVMTVFYSAAEQKEDKQSDVTNQVDKIVCTGNVEITRDDWLGTSKKMIYYAGKKEVELIGNAKFWQGQNMVSGDKIIYYMDEGRSEVLGGDGRTETVVGEGEPKKKQRVNMTIMQQ